MKSFVPMLLAVVLLGSCGKKSDPVAPPSGAGAGNAGAGAASPVAKPGSDSPKEAFEKAKAAGDKRDFGALYDSICPDETDIMVFGAMMMSAMATGGDDAKGKEFDALMKKYNFPDEKDAPKVDMDDHEAFRKALAERLKSVKDKRGFCVEAFAFSEKNSKAGNGAHFQMEGTLKDLQESGDRATAKLLHADGTEKPLVFRKYEGHWYLSTPR